jgi:hypothetical protein
LLIRGSGVSGAAIGAAEYFGCDAWRHAGGSGTPFALCAGERGSSEPSHQQPRLELATAKMASIKSWISVRPPAGRSPKEKLLRAISRASGDGRGMRSIGPSAIAAVLFANRGTRWLTARAQLRCDRSLRFCA